MSLGNVGIGADVDGSLRVRCVGAVVDFGHGVFSGQEDEGDQRQKQYGKSPAKQDTIKLQGTGQQASEKFVLEPGLAVIVMLHYGQSNVSFGPVGRELVRPSTRCSTRLANSAVSKVLALPAAESDCWTWLPRKAGPWPFASRDRPQDRHSRLSCG